MHSIDYFCIIYKIKVGDLADLLGVKQPQINAWKKGDRPIPKHHFIKLCEIFNVPEYKGYLVEKQNINEIDRSEIGIIFNKASLNNLQDDAIDEEIGNLARFKFETDITLLERNIEILNTLDNLKKVLKFQSNKTLHFPEKFYENLEKVEELIEEIKNN